MGEELTIDELARRAGVTSRNVRAYQERGLLPAPEVRGRVGYYGEAHLARLRHIAQLTERGFSLASIRELFAAWERGWGLAEVLGFEQALAAPWQEKDVAQELSAATLLSLFGGDQSTIDRGVALGLLADIGNGDYRVTNARLFVAGAGLIEVGIPVEAMLDETEALQEDMERIARRFAELFLAHIWRPYVARGMPPHELPSVTRALQRMRPIASTVVEAWFAAAMEGRIGDVSTETLAARSTPDGIASAAMTAGGTTGEHEFDA